MLNTLKTLMNL